METASKTQVTKFDYNMDCIYVCME